MNQNIKDTQDAIKNYNTIYQTLRQEEKTFLNQYFSLFEAGNTNFIHTSRNNPQTGHQIGNCYHNRQVYIDIYDNGQIELSYIKTKEYAGGSAQNLNFIIQNNEVFVSGNALQNSESYTLASTHMKEQAEKNLNILTAFSRIDQSIKTSDFTPFFEFHKKLHPMGKALLICALSKVAVEKLKEECMTPGFEVPQPLLPLHYKNQVEIIHDLKRLTKNEYEKESMPYLMGTKKDNTLNEQLHEARLKACEFLPAFITRHRIKLRVFEDILRYQYLQQELQDKTITKNRVKI